MFRSRFSALVIVLVLVICSIFNVNASEANLDTSKSKFASYSEAENNVNTQFYNLLEYFNDNYKINEYPDFYAGAYITDGNKELIIYVTDDSPEIKNIIITGTGNPNIKIEKAKYSYNELINIKDDITADITSSYKKSSFAKDENFAEMVDSFAGIGINDRNNSLTVEMSEITDEKISIFKKYIDSSDILQFEEGAPTLAQTTYKPGEQIKSSLGGATMGYGCCIIDPASGNYIVGFWTAGHAVANTGNSIYTSSDIYLGEVKVKQVSGKIDAAFVKFDSSSNTTSLSLKYGGHSLGGNIVTGFAQNSTVYMCGGYSKAEKSGTIKSTSYDDGQINDMIQASYGAIDGDSGSVTYLLVNGDYTTAGLHRGKEGYTFYSVFTKVGNIASSWNHYGY